MPERCYNALEGLEELKNSEFLVALTWSVLTDPQSNIPFLFLITTVASNGVFSLFTTIIIIIITIVIMMPKSLSHGAGCQKVS